MSGLYKVSLVRSHGWNRLGLAGAVAVLFGTPMLWALGVFGSGEDAIQRATVFLLSGLWFFTAVGYVLGWAMQGFVMRIKSDDDEDSHTGPSRPSAPPHGPAHPPGGDHRISPARQPGR